MQEQVLTLKENQVKLEQAVAVQTATIARQKADTERQSALNNVLSSKLVAAESGLSSLRKRFTQIDINQEAIVDPNGLEVRVNNAVGKLIGRIKDETTPDTGESVAAE